MTRLLLPVLLATALPACAAYSEPPLTPAAAQEVAEPLVLGPGDKLRVTVFGEERLSGVYSVSSTGTIAFPLIGNVTAKGLSVDELQVRMREALSAGYLEDPRLSIEVVDFRPFYILGEVSKPGEYPYVAGLTLRQAIATAGGYTYRAKRSRVLIKRATQDVEREIRVDERAIEVQPGDTILIPERFF